MKRKPFDRGRYRKIIVAASLGGLATAARLSPEARVARAIKAANSRWARARAAAAGDSGYPLSESSPLEPADSEEVMGL